MQNIIPKQRLDYLINFFNRAPLKETFGIDISFEENGNAIFKMPYNQKFDHTMGGIFGGTIASLLDCAGWYTVASRYETWVNTVNLNMQILSASKEVDLIATGKIERAGKSMAFAKMELSEDNPSQKLLTTATGVFSVSSIPINTI